MMQANPISMSPGPTDQSTTSFHSYENIVFDHSQSSNGQPVPDLQQSNEGSKIKDNRVLKTNGISSITPSSNNLISTSSSMAQSSITTTTTTTSSIPSSSQQSTSNGQSTASSEATGSSMARNQGNSSSSSSNNNNLSAATTNPLYMQSSDDEFSYKDSPFSLNPTQIHQCSSTTTTHQTLSGSTIRLSSKGLPAQELVTRLISFPAISSMDSIKEWSLNSLKCAKQIINEKRGLGSITSDVQLQAEIDQLKINQGRLMKFLKIAQQMRNHYTNLINDQRQLHSLMNEMSIKSFQLTGLNYQNVQSSSSSTSNYKKNAKKLNGKHIVTNFSSLSANLSNTFATKSPKRILHKPNESSTCHDQDDMDDLIPIIQHIKSSNVNITEDFKKNSSILSNSIKNGEKLLAALNFFCSNLSTLIYKTMDDTISTIRQLESVRLDYDAERNSLNSISSMSSQNMNNTAYSSDRLELAKARYDQLRIDVQIKMQFLEENTIKVVHKQMVLFNNAFASYSNGDSNALDATLSQFSIKY